MSLTREPSAPFVAVSPVTGRLVRQLPAADAGEIEGKLEAAHQARLTWRRVSFRERGRLLIEVARRLRGDRERFARRMTEEMGKPIVEARGEVEKSAWCAEHYAAHAEVYLAPISIGSDATRSYVQHLPLGVALGILPWNAPFWLAFRFCAPALMAGNPCLIKHDPHVPGCGEAIEALFREAGAPPGILQNLRAPTSRVEALIADPRVRAVSFTGSDRAGALVAAAAGAQIKPVVLELGGSDPAVILQGADLAQAAEVLTRSRTVNAGQSCIAAKRIIVEAPVHDAFLAQLRPRLEALIVGDPAEESTQIGPLARADLRDHLHRQVRGTLQEGARCLLGGKLPEGPGFFYPVTLLTEVHPTMIAAKEETFGPVAVVMRAQDAEHAMALANQTPYGLGASIWCETGRGEALAADFEAGQVAVNGLVKTDPRLPSGGVKRSGIGRELGPHGIHAFVNAQQVWVGPRVS